MAIVIIQTLKDRKIRKIDTEIKKTENNETQREIKRDKEINKNTEIMAMKAQFPR